MVAARKMLGVALVVHGLALYALADSSALATTMIEPSLRGASAGASSTTMWPSEPDAISTVAPTTRFTPLATSAARAVTTAGPSALDATGTAASTTEFAILATSTAQPSTTAGLSAMDPTSTTAPTAGLLVTAVGPTAMDATSTGAPTSGLNALATSAAGLTTATRPGALDATSTAVPAAGFLATSAVQPGTTAGPSTTDAISTAVPTTEFAFPATSATQPATTTGPPTTTTVPLFTTTTLPRATAGAKTASSRAHISLRRYLARREVLRHEEVAAYASLYHNTIAQRQMVYWLHVGKSGGTFLCACGNFNGCVSPENSCHASKKAASRVEFPVWFKNPPAVPNGECAEMLAFYQERGIDVVGNEAYLVPRGGLCRTFWNAVVVRDPIRRLVLHLGMMKRSTLVREPWGFETVIRDYGAVANNYYIRSLLGHEVFTLPFGSITRQHLEEAKSVLERFDIVLTLDGEASPLADKVNLTLGWHDCSEAPTANKWSQGHVSDIESTSGWSREQWSQMRAYNALDFELYEHAGMLERLDLRVFEHSAFRDAPPHCSRGSCGYLCK
mmetsp:Transcript_27950/g.76833  ORF Transcript_27950/g.76833 Transcript_27950/m.76833 type:complete len:561 (-) Transcript_27950:244-1926(-)